MRGGKRDGAGRKAGAPNKATQERQEEVAKTGTTPLQYMLSVMRDETEPKDRRDDMAKAAAPYVHPKLASTEVKGEQTVKHVIRLPASPKDMAEWNKRYSPKK